MPLRFIRLSDKDGHGALKKSHNVAAKISHRIHHLSDSAHYGCAVFFNYPPHNHTKAAREGRAMQTNSDKLRLFLIDDSSLVRERLRALLSEAPGVEIVGEADDADSAMKGVCELKPDAITLDIHLPGPNGFVVLQRLRRQWPRFAQAPIVIVLSNYPHEAYRRKALGMGANFFFDKSTEFEKVRDVLQVMAQPMNVPLDKLPSSPFGALTADLLRAHPFVASR